MNYALKYLKEITKEAEAMKFEPLGEKQATETTVEPLSADIVNVLPTTSKNAPTGLKSAENASCNWKVIFNGLSAINEGDLVKNVLLSFDNSLSVTEAINLIHKDAYNGYIKQTENYSHVWELR